MKTDANRSAQPELRGRLPLVDGSPDHGHTFALKISAKSAGLWVVAILLILLCAGCGDGNTRTSITVKPVFLPVAFNIGPSGISITGNETIATPIGVFSIGASYELPTRNSGSIYVVLRDRRIGFDHIYDVQTGVNQFTAVINGATTIAIANGQVLIDVTDGSIKRVTFKQVIYHVSEADSVNWLGRLWRNAFGRWIVIICVLLLVRVVRRGLI
jgi:hypothetical protein